MVQTTFSAGSASSLALDIEQINSGGADAGTNQSYTITLTADIALNAGLPAINLQSGSSLTIVGQGYSINGGSAYNGLFLHAGSLVLQDITIENMLARGGAGQSETGDAGAGGGGAGLGGGLFIQGGASATLSDATFLNDAVIGGAGGNATPTTAVAGTPAGGLLDGVYSLGIGDGGAGATGPANPASPLGAGSPGQFGGGGGGGAGTGTLGAAGGFGAGDGAAVSDGEGLAGGGGLGAGGDIFVQQGGNLTIDGGTLSGGTASGGAGGATVENGTTLYAANGFGLDSGIFVQGNNTITLAPLTGDTEVIADTIGDESGASLSSDVGTGTGTLALNIAGDVVLEAANNYTGGTTVQTGGTLELSGLGTAGSGAITLDGTSTLQLDGNISVGHVTVTDPATVTVNGTNAIGGLSGYTWLAGDGVLQLGSSVPGSNLIVSYYVTLQLESAGEIPAGELLDLFDGTLDLNGFNQTLTNPVGFGTVLLNGATLTLGAPPTPAELDWAFSGPGLVDVPTGLTLTLDAPLTAQLELSQDSALTLTAGAGSGGTIEFVGTGDVLTFDLLDGAPVAGTIDGFNATDTIIVTGTVTAVNNTDAGLVLQDGSTILGTLDLIGSDSGDGFLTVPAFGTNTEIVLYQASIDMNNGTTDIAPASGTIASLDQLLTDPNIATDGTIGTLVISGSGTMEATGTVTIDDLEASAGSTLLLDGGVVMTDPVTIDAQGNIGGFGTLTGVGTVNGTIAPSGGTLDIIGSDIELGVTLDANALILVTGAGNALDTQGSPLSIGAGGSGTLLVEAAGTFTSAGGTTAAGALALGTASGGSGYVTVTDTGSVLDDAGAFIIGGSGIETDGTPQPGGLGALFITASGSVTAASADIAADPGSDGSSATVTGTGSEWTIGGSLIVGDLAAGSLAITAGGSVSAANLTVGNSTSGVGDLSVSGTTSVLSLGTQLVVGAAGIGDVAISNGATISAASGTIGADAGASGVVDIEGANSRLDISGDLDIGWGGTGVVVMGASTTLSVEGDLNIGASGQLIQFGGVIDPANVTNHGTAGGAGTLDVTGTLTNDGVYYAESGTYVMNVGTLITGSGTLVVDDGGDLVVNAGSVANTEQVSFNNDTLAAVLTIGTLGTFSGVLDNFGSLDSIVLTGTAVGSDAYTAGSGGEDGVLTLYAGPDQSGAVLGTLAVSADITMAGVAELEMVNDGTIGDPACFAAGTRIAIEQGEAAVEQLREGDLVLTVDGALVPVVWIGHRRVDCRRHPRPEAVWPVRVAAGAFGPARPRRDLLLSPDHGLYFDSGKAPVLIPVRYLVNGSTIARITVDEVTYYHVELPRHDVLLAEGLPAESYLDTGDRGNFVNGGVSVTLHPDFATLVWEGRGCAPLVVTGPEVDAARAIAMPTVAWLQRCPNPDMLDEGRPSTSVPEREGDTAEESSNRYHMSPLTC